jgi:hypothetical protein
MMGGSDFLEQTGGHYQFQWRHAAACPASGITQVRTTLEGKFHESVLWDR